MSNSVFIVGLGGPSGSGKTTVARRVAARLNGQVISMEVYSAESNHLPFEERAKRNYDEPEAIDVELLESHIRSFAAGRSIGAPVYDFAQHLRTERREHVPAKPLAIVEGILALHFAQLPYYFDLSVYLDAPEDVCFHRRKVGDITERQRPLELVKWQYENTVLPAARRYLPHCKSCANLVFDAKPDLDTVGNSLYNAIVQRYAAAARSGS